MRRSGVSLLVILMFFSFGIPGCLETACDIHGEIDNSLGSNDEVIVHLVTKDCKTCPWQVKASAYAYSGVETFCFVTDGDAKILFDNLNQYVKGDEISEGAGHEITSGEYDFTVGEDGTIKDSEGNIYSFF